MTPGIETKGRGKSAGRASLGASADARPRMRTLNAWP
jgi:hypothetical protein